VTDDEESSRFRTEALVTIARFETTFEASLARGALEAIGIRTLVPGEGIGSFSTHRGGIAGTELQVFASDAARAATELRRLQMRIVPPTETD
jgi:hypothetical protein